MEFREVKSKLHRPDARNRADSLPAIWGLSEVLDQHQIRARGDAPRVQDRLPIRGHGQAMEQVALDCCDQAAAATGKLMEEQRVLFAFGSATVVNSVLEDREVPACADVVEDLSFGTPVHRSSE